MKVGDLVKMKWRGNGHPGIGLIVATVDGEYMILWDLPQWGLSNRWKSRELKVINESR
tara:strand:- start:502 stop:675 length:174 start_codon:yes stop_codon:yes gene_type:complete